MKTVERKLRLPWSVFDAVAREMEADPGLAESQAPNRRAVPSQLKLAAALRHLATGHSFDGWRVLKLSGQAMLVRLGKVFTMDDGMQIQRYSVRAEKHR